MTGDESIMSASSVFVNTNLAAATAAAVTMIITWIRYKKPDVSMTLNGALAGLVAITAGCDMVNPVGAFCIGIIASFVVVFGVEFVDQKLKIDDPVGAFGVHGLCGATGTILTGVFALDGGVLYGGGFSFLGVQVLGVVSVAAWVAIAMMIIFTVIKKTIGLRVSEEEEIAGLDIMEHGISSSYADFMPMAIGGTSFRPEEKSVAAPVVPADKAIPVENYAVKSDAKITKVVVVTKANRFEILKSALDKLDITGMTTTRVLGCGMQKGAPEYYRGVPMETTLLPKIKVEIVVCKVPVETLISVIKEALYTGSIGDGKIFIYDVENVIKVRTGESGYDALQDE